MSADVLAFETQADPASGGGEAALIIDVEGYEGPLDLLLVLARQQKVDLTKISVLALAEQYLAFVEHAGRMQLELAADYLVMAAWLAYLKSRLLVPAPAGETEGESAADLATALAFRLRRLEAFRAAADALTARPQLGRDVFGRGAPEPVADVKRPDWSATLFDLLSAYAAQRRKTAISRVRFARRAVWSLAEARDALQRLIGRSADWSRLDAFLLTYAVEPAMRATVFASTFAATLELVREGTIDLHQPATFGPIFLRKHGNGQAPAALAAVPPPDDARGPEGETTP